MDEKDGKAMYMYMSLKSALGADQAVRLSVCSHLQLQTLAVVMVQSHTL